MFNGLLSSKKFKIALRFVLDEIILIVGFAVTYVSIQLATVFEFNSLWFSLAALIFTALAYSWRFFRYEQSFTRFIYYVFVSFLIIGYFAIIYKAFGIIDTSKSDELVKGGWTNAIYFSVVTWTTLGYGDFKPTDVLKLWAITEAFLGQVFMALLIAKMTVFLNKK